MYLTPSKESVNPTQELIKTHAELAYEYSVGVPSKQKKNKHAKPLKPVWE